MNVIRMEQMRIRRLEIARIGTWSWLVLLLSMFLMFACSFAIGRLTHVKSASPRPGVPQEVRVAFVRAGIPQGLSLMPPIPSLVASKPKAEAKKAQAESSAAAIVAPSHAPTVETAPALPSKPSTAPSISPLPARVPSRAPSPPAAPAPTPSKSGAGGGGAFESSG
jgi:hypothetical protein